MKIISHEEYPKIKKNLSLISKTNYSILFLESGVLIYAIPVENCRIKKLYGCTFIYTS
jgi:hypothetical protein